MRRFIELPVRRPTWRHDNRSGGRVRIEDEVYPLTVALDAILHVAPRNPEDVDRGEMHPEDSCILVVKGGAFVLDMDYDYARDLLGDVRIIGDPE